MSPTSDLQRKTCDLAQFKLSEEGSGGFEGYASVFSVLDRQGEIVAPGAFAKTLGQFEQTGFITVAHDWDALPIASIKRSREDAKGLLIEAEYHSTPEAQACRTYVRERLGRGKSVPLSIGYWVRDSLPSADGLLLKELELAECSLVTVPANPEAGVSSAKARAARAAGGAPPHPLPATAAKASYLGADAEMEMTWSVVNSLGYSLQDALYTCLFGSQGPREEKLARVDACLTEYHQLVLKALTALYPEEAPTEALAAEVKIAWNLADPSDPPAGKEFDRQIERTLADLTDLIPRSREIAAMRAKQGRTLSAARRQDLATLHAGLGVLLQEFTPRAAVAERQAAELSLYRRKARMRAGDLPCLP